MKSFKKVLVVLLVLLLGGVALGNASRNETILLSPVEMGQIFGEDSHQVSFACLDEQEMKKVKGKFGVPGAIVGGIAGASGYLGQAMVSGQGDLKGLVQAAILGAAGGFFVGPANNILVHSIVQGQVFFYAGMAVGSCRTCHGERHIEGM